MKIGVAPLVLLCCAAVVRGQEAAPLDPREALIDELEDHFFTPQTSALQRLDANRWEDFLAARFSGTGFFQTDDAAPQHRSVGLGTEEIFSESRLSLSRSAAARKTAEFLNRLERVIECQMKFKSIQLGAARGVAEGKLKVRLDGLEKGGAPICFKGLYDVNLRNISGRWHYQRIQRLSATVTRAPRPLFEEITAQTGIALTLPRGQGRVPYAGSERHVAVSGGVLVGDFDGDGWDDVLLTSWAKILLYRNRGDGTLEEVTARSGLKYPEGLLPTGGIFFDFNNNGRQDLLLTGVARRSSDGSSVRLYRNDGEGRFTDVTLEAGLFRLGPAMSACAADIDRDGFLDVYVCYYGRGSDPSSITQAADGEPNALFRNRGDGTFEEIGKAAGVNNRGWSLAAGFGDYNEDGLPDLFVTNDYGHNALYQNNGDRTFSNVTEPAGGAAAGFGMGVSWGDFDRDGRLDVYVTKMSSTAGKRLFERRDPDIADDSWGRLLQSVAGNSLLRNNGDGTFTDVAAKTGSDDAGWAWGGQFFDYNNDGWADIFAPNGFLSGRFKKDT